MPSTDTWRSPDLILDEVRGRAAGRRRARRIRIGAAGATAVAGALLILPQAQATRPHTVRVADSGRVPVTQAAVEAPASPDGSAVAGPVASRVDGGAGASASSKPPGMPTTSIPAKPLTSVPPISPSNPLRLVPAIQDAAHDEVGNDGSTDIIWATVAYSGPTDTVDFITTVRDMATGPLSVEYAASFSWDGYGYGVYGDILPNAKPSVSVGGEKCDGCQVVVDTRSNRATVRVPRQFLNDVVKRASSQGSGLTGNQRPPSPPIGAGSTISNLSWHSARIRPVGASGWTTDVPDNHDDAPRADPWKIPEL